MNWFLLWTSQRININDLSLSLPELSPSSLYLDHSFSLLTRLWYFWLWIKENRNLEIILTSNIIFLLLKNLLCRFYNLSLFIFLLYKDVQLLKISFQLINLFLSLSLFFRFLNEPFSFLKIYEFLEWLLLRDSRTLVIIDEDLICFLNRAVVWSFKGWLLDSFEVWFLSRLALFFFSFTSVKCGFVCFSFSKFVSDF